jgi:hypothetical protein
MIIQSINYVGDITEIACMVAPSYDWSRDWTFFRFPFSVSCVQKVDSTVALFAHIVLRY